MEHHHQSESRRHPARSNGGSLLTEEQGFVFIVDDDASVRAALEDLLGSIGLNVQSFGTVQEFLDSKRPDVAGCWRATHVLARRRARSATQGSNELPAFPERVAHAPRGASEGLVWRSASQVVGVRW